MLYLLAFTLGLCLGSFYTALASRILYFYYGPGRKKIKRELTAYMMHQPLAKKHAQRSLALRTLWRVLTQPSFCFGCQRRIAASKLIPIWGYLSSRARCSACRRPIGISTFLGELYLGLLFLFSYITYENYLIAILTACFCGHLYISLATDSRFFLLDLENAFCLFLLAILSLFAWHGFSLAAMQHKLLAFSGAFLVFGLLCILGRFQSLGFGDVLLASVIALFIGLPWSLIVFQAAALASIIYILIIKKDRRAPAPLGAAMAIAFFFILFLSMIFDESQRPMKKHAPTTLPSPSL